jgi:hypothetical protein
MTISSTDDPRAGPFNGNGSQTAFPFEFKAFAEEDLLVVQTDEDGLETTLVLDSDYTVSLNADQNADAGGTVTLAVAPPTGETLTVASNLEFTQETDITNGGGFYPEVIETALDRNTMLVKQVNEKVNRALRVAVSTPDDVDVTLPAPVAQKIIGWNDSGTGLVNRDIADFATVVAFAAWQSQTFSGTGAQTAFVLSSDPGNINNLDIAISGVTQVPGIDFTLSGTTLTFTSAPPTGTDNVFVRWGQALPQGESDADQVSFSSDDQDPGGTIGGQIYFRSVMEHGAARANTNAQNKTALQAAITAASASGRYTIIVVPPSINYGYEVDDLATHPNFTGATTPILVIDYSPGNSYAGFPTAYDGMQERRFMWTPQTTSPGQHDGNVFEIMSAWSPHFIARNIANIAAVGHPSRTANDNRRCGFAYGVDGQISWEWIQGTLTGAGYTDEEMSNLALQKFAIDGDTLGAYVSFNIERKTGNISYGGGRNVPAAHHHFEPVSGSPSLYLAMWQETGGTRTRTVWREPAGSGAADAYAYNDGTVWGLNTPPGDALQVTIANRRVWVPGSLRLRRSAPTWGASITIDTTLGNFFTITASSGIAYAITQPGTGEDGAEITITVRNTSGGALGAATWSTAYKMSAWTNPANGFSRSISFVCDGTNWIEKSRTPADVPN